MTTAIRTRLRGDGVFASALRAAVVAVVAGGGVAARSGSCPRIVVPHAASSSDSARVAITAAPVRAPEAG